MPEKNNLKGLLPYQEEDHFSFYGREKEVENLLQIIQKNKLITLTGVSGSGKTSLINAGLIPRLKKGFLGQAGKEWSICKFRPGVNPIENMIAALTNSGILKKDYRANTEDFANYKKIIEDDKNLSLSKIYRDSEIYNQRNLLIVVDQLEDIFVFEKIIKEKNSNDQLLLDIISRTVRFKETSIYFLICLQTEYISELTNYASLQELFSKSQYAIQNIGSSGLKSLITNNFTSNGIGFDSSAFNHLLEKSTQDLSLLPNVQFLLYCLFNKYKNKDSVTKDMIHEIGGVKNVIGNKFESLFQSLSETDQTNFEKIVKATINFEKNQDNDLSNSFGQILNISGVERSTSNELIKLFKNELGESIEFFENKISGVQRKNNKSINLDDIVGFNYEKNKNWDREQDWVEEEKIAFQNYSEYALQAQKYSIGEISLLNSPELEMAINWKNSNSVDENWAKKYSLNFSKTINYINESEKFFNQNKEKEEQRIKRKRRITRNIIIGFSCLTIIIGIVGVDAYVNGKRAKEQSEIAAKESIAAKRAQAQAEASEKDAKKEKENADIQRIKAEKARLNAEKATIFARKSLEKARRSAKEAEEQRKIAEASQEDAEKERTEALKQKEKADKAKLQADKLKEIAELETEFYPLMLELENLTNESNDVEPNSKILISIEQTLEKYYKYEKLMIQTDSGKIVTEGLFVLLQTALKALEKKPNYRETSMLIKKIKPSASIRTISTYENKIIAIGGDDQFLYVLNGATKNEIEPIKINERIRKIVIADSNTIFVGTFKGNVFKIDLTAQNTRARKKKIYEDGTVIKELYYKSNSAHLFIVSSKDISIYDGQDSSTLIETKNINSTYYNKNLNKLYVATDDGIYFLLESELKPISLRKINLNTDKISAISFTGNRMFLGTGSGELYVYKLNNETRTRISLEFEGKIIVHRSEITRLFYDQSNDNLYSASFDNKVLKFNTTLKDISKIKNSAISLTGHQKWVWDINLIQDRKGNYLVVTADENGNLLSWFDKIDKLADKVYRLISEN
ncbi:MAG: hypothetical protein P8J71_00895 [Flavobacteriaceae bacterium]|nr:hypothetical protein [Flavobacteriaceae bacterium]